MADCLLISHLILMSIGTIPLDKLMDSSVRLINSTDCFAKILLGEIS